MSHTVALLMPEPRVKLGIPPTAVWLPTQNTTIIIRGHSPAGRAAGARGAAYHLGGGHGRAVVLVGLLAVAVRYGDAVVAPFR